MPGAKAGAEGGAGHRRAGESEVAASQRDLERRADGASGVACGRLDEQLLDAARVTITPDGETTLSRSGWTATL